jgi:hypothetical protein
MWALRPDTTVGHETTSNRDGPPHWRSCRGRTIASHSALRRFGVSVCNQRPSSSDRSHEARKRRLDTELITPLQEWFLRESPSKKRPTMRPTFRPTGPVARLASHLIPLQNSGVRRFPGAPTTLFGARHPHQALRHPCLAQELRTQVLLSRARP